MLLDRSGKNPVRAPPAGGTDETGGGRLTLSKAYFRAEDEKSCTEMKVMVVKMMLHSYKDPQELEGLQAG